MNPRRALAAVLLTTAVAVPAVASALPAQAAARTYANCTALHADYPHGVGRPGAVDHVRGKTKPVTTFTRSAALYQANSKSDRDGDGVACEKA